MIVVEEVIVVTRKEDAAVGIANVIVVAKEVKVVMLAVIVAVVRT